MRNSDRLEAMASFPPDDATASARASDVLGPLAPLASWPGVTDILVNGDGSVWVDGTAGLRKVPVDMGSESEVRRFATALIATGGRHVDFATPLADVRFPGGYRIHVVVPPVSPTGTHISIRVPSPVMPSLALFDDSPWLAVVRASVARRDNILICGPTGSGKTTLLSALIGDVPASERIIAVEDVHEIVATHPHLVSLEARQANTDGHGSVDLSLLVRACLRMRPDRIVVGECRGAEIRDLINALSTGHSGSMATVHANDLESVPARLEALGELAGLRGTTLAAQVVAAIDVVVMVERNGHARRIAAVGRVGVEDGVLHIDPVGVDAEDTSPGIRSSDQRTRDHELGVGASSEGVWVATR